MHHHSVQNHRHGGSRTLREICRAPRRPGHTHDQHVAVRGELASEPSIPVATSNTSPGVSRRWRT